MRWKRYGSVSTEALALLADVERFGAPELLGSRPQTSPFLIERVASAYTASTCELATARTGVARSQVPQREAAVEPLLLPRTAVAAASLAAGRGPRRGSRKPLPPFPDAFDLDLDEPGDHRDVLLLVANLATCGTSTATIAFMAEHSSACPRAGHSLVADALVRAGPRRTTGFLEALV